MRSSRQQFAFDVLDATKIIPEEDVPIRRVGRLVLDRCVDNFFAETEQVAFGTLNIVPGIDFTNDPLLQGRNFSYLDTQLKRLGSPNFTHIPVNAPKCPFHHFQQDGHMAMLNPKGRVNYEPNSWSGAAGGPRESPEQGFRSYPAAEEGPKLRLRSESFADHYSQARQFYMSQTETEQQHIADALIFELSKVETLAIRTRIVSHLLNIDHGSGRTRGGRLAPQGDAQAGRRRAAHAGASAEVSGPEYPVERPDQFYRTQGRGTRHRWGGYATSCRRSKRPWKRKARFWRSSRRTLAGSRPATARGSKRPSRLHGGPSVLYDAVALLPSADGVELLVQEPTARDFVADAFAHCKFIGYVEAALPLFEKAGVPDSRDDGCIALAGPEGCAAFVATCRQLRFWAREAVMQHVQQQGV